MNISLVLTHNCNLACKYCYAGEKRAVAMEWDMAKRALDFAFEQTLAQPRLDLAKKPKMQLGFFGGEPLLAWDMLKRSADYTLELAQKRDIELLLTVTTNATLITGEKINWLAERNIYPALSIDGNRAMHEATRPLRSGGSSFDQCLAGLEIALARVPNLEVIAVPDPANICHVADGVRFLADEKKVLRVSLNPNFFANWDDASLAEWRRTYEEVGDFFLARYRAHQPLAINFIDGKIITRLKNGFECSDKCDFGEKEIAVAPSGNIYPCERLVGDDNDGKICIGNVLRGFDEGKRQAILSKRGNIDDECRDCASLSRCMNWCCCINYALTGEINHTGGPVCFHERTAIAVADRVGGQLYQETNPAFLARFYYEDPQIVLEALKGRM